MAVLKEFLLFCYLFVGLNGDDDVVYKPKITDTVKSCADFENELLNCDGLVLGSAKGEDGEEAKLGGTFVTSVELSSDHDIEINIWKEMEMDDQFMTSMRVNFCKSLEDTDAPWYPLAQTLNMTSCPIPPNTFEVAEINISLDSVKDVMCHEFCGQYRIEMSFLDKTDMLSCHIIELSIVEE